MAFLTFVKIAGIDGESKDSAHPGWIEAHALHYVVAKPAKSTHGQADRVTHNPITIWKAMDVSSPLIIMALCQNKKIPEVTIELCRAGGSDKVKFMEIKLTGCTICDYKIQPQPQSKEVGETLPLEEFSVDYEVIKATYFQQKRADGSIGGQAVAGWNLKTNSPA